MKGKAWYMSKTFWTNLIALISMFSASQFGISIDPKTAVSILAVINLVLRFITKEPIVWQ